MIFPQFFCSGAKEVANDLGHQDPFRSARGANRAPVDELSVSSSFSRSKIARTGPSPSFQTQLDAKLDAFTYSKVCLVVNWAKPVNDQTTNSNTSRIFMQHGFQDICLPDKQHATKLNQELISKVSTWKPCFLTCPSFQKSLSVIVDGCWWGPVCGN